MNCDETIRKALEKIKRDSKICGPVCGCCFNPTGPTGPAGETPNITIGTVTTGDPGTEASATITGTAPNFVLNLTIPQGPTGPAPVNEVKKQ